MNNKKAVFFSCLSDSLLKLTYYDRKGSEILSVDDVETLLNSGEVTLAEIQAEVAKFFTSSFKMPVDLEAIPDLRNDL